MKLWILFAVVLSINTCYSCVNKMKLDVYYESLCPDSVRFISQQLHSNYEQFKNHLDITLIPHGKSDSFQTPEGKIDFTCQHGPDECFGNKVQACMLSRIRDQDTQVAYAACQMQSTADRTHRTCVEAFGVSWDEILHCAESDFATNQQLEFERITKPILSKTNWVPSVIFNGQLNEYTRYSSSTPPLKDIICAYISHSNPACENFSPAKAC